MVKAADMLIARRADTRARADFATWKMLAKLNGTSALPQEAQNFLVAYQKFLRQMTDADASEATITLMYRSLLCRDGRRRRPTRHSLAPERAGRRQRHRLPPPGPRPKPSAAAYPSGTGAKPRLPVALIFICLVVVYVGIRYFWR